MQRQILEHDVAPVAAPARDETAHHEIHLPATMTDLVGRASELAAVAELLGEHRLVTLTGTAGTGKTRLAVEVARQAAPAYPDGVWFVDLAPVEGGEPVAEVVGATIGGTAAAGSAEEALRTAVRGRRMLLVVDNCEHLLADAAEAVTTVLGAGTAVTVLATSREPLDLDGEVLYPVAPLDAAGGDLFVARLRTAVPGLAVTGEVRQRAAEICSDLDGLPLAIELAAARARVYGLDEIRDQVRADPVRLARIGRPKTERRQSLQSALDWGHRLLTPTEQLVHRRLAALPGPFGLRAAAATVGLPVEETADLLAMLVNRSLLTAAPAPRPGGPTLFRQLVVVRAHAEDWPRCSPTRAASTAAASTARSGSPWPTGSGPASAARSGSTSPSRPGTSGPRAIPRRAGGCSTASPAATRCWRCSPTQPAASSRATSPTRRRRWSAPRPCTRGPGHSTWMSRRGWPPAPAATPPSRRAPPRSG